MKPGDLLKFIGLPRCPDADDWIEWTCLVVEVHGEKTTKNGISYVTSCLWGDGSITIEELFNDEYMVVK